MTLTAPNMQPSLKHHLTRLRMQLSAIRLCAIAFLVISLASCSEVGNRMPGALKQEVTVLDSTQIFPELFPADHHFDEQHRLVRTVVRGRDAKELHSAVGNVFTYREGKDHRALVVPYSYDLSNGHAPECEACFPEMDVASFKWRAGGWRVQEFIQNWPKASGARGKPAAITFDSTGDKKCFVLHSEYSNRGQYFASREYFDAENLKLLKTVPDR
jgi:hypothetical protein